jgi:hypothetical protein
MTATRGATHVRAGALAHCLHGKGVTVVSRQADTLVPDRPRGGEDATIGEPT